MAKQKVYSAYDSKLQLWYQPMFFEHPGQCERTWKDLCSEPGSILYKNPQDFTLYQIGEFNTSTAELSTITPVQFMTAVSALVAQMPNSDYPQAVNR